MAGVGATSAKVIQRKLCISGMKFNSTILRDVVTVLRAGEMVVGVGDITIHVPAGVQDNDVESLLGVKKNKPLDVLIFMSLSPEHVAAFVTFVRGEAAPSPEESSKRSDYACNVLSNTVAMYLLHGTIAHMFTASGVIPKYALNATRMEKKDFVASDLCSIPTIGSAKFPGLVENFFDIAPYFHSTFGSRAKLGFGGGRVFSILARIATTGKDMTKAPAVLQYMMQKEVLSGAPYITFHPDHPKNPMKDAAKGLFAAIGHFGKQAGIVWDDEFKIQKGLYIAGVRERLLAEWSSSTVVMPTLEAIIDATGPEFSLSRLG